MFSKFHSLNSRLAIAILSFSLFLVYVTANAPTPMYMLWQKNIHYSATGISVIFIVYHLGIALSLLSFSRIKNPRTTKLLLITALIGTMIAAGLFASAHDFWQLVAARVIIGVCCGIFVSCGISLIIQIGFYKQVHNTPLLVTLSCVMGFGLGPFYAGVLADRVSSPSHWIFLPLIIGLMVCLLLLLPLKASSPQSTTSAENHQSSMPRNLSTMFMTIALFAPPFALSGLFISLGPNMVASLMHNHSRTVAGAIPLLLFGCGTIAQLLLNRLTINKQLGLGILTACLGGIGVWIAEMDHSVLMMTLAAMLSGIGQSLCQLAGTRLIKQYQPMGNIRSSTSAFFLGGYLFAALTIFILGWASTHFGLLTGSVIFLLMCLLLLMCGTWRFMTFHPQLQRVSA